MELSRKIRLFAASLGLSAACAAAGCTESKASTESAATCGAAPCKPSCIAELRGNMSGDVALGKDCGTLSVAADAGRDGTYLLAFHGRSAQIASADIAVYLGATPTPGSFGAQSVTQWSMTAKSNLKPGCTLRAGSGSVPAGSFALSLRSVSLTSGDAESGGSAHGSLSATLYVHASPGTDCGAGEVEHVAIAF
jgi:hypothetical protein